MAAPINSTGANRNNATKEPQAGQSQPAPLDASKLTYTLTTSPRPVPDLDAAASSRETVCTDHMVTATWRAGEGWSPPELRPYGPLSLMPTASCLHYATECFEGLKVYRGLDGGLRMFRPRDSAERFRVSATRVALPDFDAGEVVALMASLLSVDGVRWLPRDKPGSFLYIRPTLIGTQPQLTVMAPGEALMYIIVSFIPRLDTPPGGLRLLTSPDDTVRAWAGGFGHVKVGANYGPSLVAAAEARRQGYNQILWLYGPDRECTEAGTSNFFVVWRTRDGRRELITAPPDGGLILDGIIRRSFLQLARERLGDAVVVTERKYSVGEVLEAHDEGRILEAFVTGTAIHHRGRDINIPVGSDGQPGEITNKVKNWLSDINCGRTNHEWAFLVSEKDQY